MESCTSLSPQTLGAVLDGGHHLVAPSGRGQPPGWGPPGVLRYITAVRGRRRWWGCFPRGPIPYPHPPPGAVRAMIGRGANLEGEAKVAW